MKLKDWMEYGAGGLRNFIPEPQPNAVPDSPYFKHKGPEDTDPPAMAPMVPEWAMDQYNENPFKYWEGVQSPGPSEDQYKDLWAKHFRHRRYNSEPLEDWEMELLRHHQNFLRKKYGWRVPNDIYHDVWPKGEPRFPDVYPFDEQEDYERIDKKFWNEEGYSDNEQERWNYYNKILRGRGFYDVEAPEFVPPEVEQYYREWDDIKREKGETEYHMKRIDPGQVNPNFTNEPPSISEREKRRNREWRM